MKLVTKKYNRGLWFVKCIASYIALQVRMPYPGVCHEIFAKTVTESCTQATSGKKADNVRTNSTGLIEETVH